MTINFAITYFDSSSKSVGYVSGSDTWTSIKEDDKIIHSFHANKSFCGKDFVGYLCGSVCIEVNPSDIINTEKVFSKSIHSLDNLFDDIESGMNYSDIPLIKNSRGYRLLIGKRSDEMLELYTISNMRKTKKNIAKTLHKITPRSYFHRKESLLFIAPRIFDYVVMSTEKRLNFKEAKEYIHKIFRNGSNNVFGLDKDYKLEQLTVHNIAFNGITDISNLFKNL